MTRYFLCGLISVLVLLTGSACTSISHSAGKQLERSFVYDALRKMDDKAFEESLRSGADPDMIFSNGATPLIMAVLRNRPDRVKRLLEAGADPKYATERGSTALHTAAALARRECVDLLLKAGCDPDQPGSYGRTALMEAARTGNLPVVKSLLDKGCDLHAKDRLGRTALIHGACAHKEPLSMVKYLISRGADPMAADDEMKLAVMYAAQLRHTDAALYLLDLITDLPKRPALGLMIMHSAIQGGDVKVVETLIDRRLPLNRTPSMIFKGSKLLNTSRALRILIRNGILSRGRTPIHWAALANNKQIAALLIKRGADCLQKDEAGDTADELATSPEVSSYIRSRQKEVLRKMKRDQRK